MTQLGNKIRLSREAFEVRMQDEFWKKMYDNCPEKFEITDDPRERDDDDGNDS